MSRSAHLASFCLLMSMAAADAVALSVRTFVASTGNDANPCTLSLPCRSFQPAIAAVAAGGEVVALDSAGYGPFTVDRSVTISGEGVHAAITASSPTPAAVDVSATTATDKVSLRHLFLEGGAQNSGVIGVRAIGALAALYIDDCVISGLDDGIVVQPGLLGAVSNDTEVHVANTIVKSILRDGVFVQGAGAGHVHMTVDRCAFHSAGLAGIVVAAQADAVITESTASENGIGNASTFAGGFVATNASGVITLDRCIAFHNQNGINAHGAQDVVFVANSTITANNTGLLIVTIGGGSGAIFTLGGNHLVDNLASDAFSGSVPTQ